MRQAENDGAGNFVGIIRKATAKAASPWEIDRC